MIDHVRNVTGQERIQYVGFSMGTTGFMVAANEHPEEIERKVKMAHLMAPIAYIKHARTPLVTLLPIWDLIEVPFGVGIQIDSRSLEAHVPKSKFCFCDRTECHCDSYKVS